MLKKIILILYSRSTNPSVANVQRNTSFLQAFKPLSIHAKVYDRIRNKKGQSQNTSYYYGEHSQNQRIDNNKSSKGKYQEQSNEDIKNKKVQNKTNNFQNEFNDQNQQKQEMTVFPKACKIPQFPENNSPPKLHSSPDQIPKPNFQTTQFSNQPTFPTREMTDDNLNNTLPLDQIKSKLQMLHKNQMNHNITPQFSSPSQPDDQHQIHTNPIISDEDIYVNASEI